MADERGHRDDRLVGGVNRPLHVLLRGVDLDIFRQLGRVEEFQRLGVHDLLGNILEFLVEESLLAVVRDLLGRVEGDIEVMAVEHPFFERFFDLVVVTLGEDESSVLLQEISGVPEVFAGVDREAEAGKPRVLLHFFDDFIHVAPFNR